MRKLIRLFLALCLMGATTMTVAAEDTTADALAKLNTAKENLETIKKENAVYGNTITACQY